jgi:hypothetical protein
MATAMNGLAFPRRFLVSTRYAGLSRAAAYAPFVLRCAVSLCDPVVSVTSVVGACESRREPGASILKPERL